MVLRRLLMNVTMSQAHMRLDCRQPDSGRTISTLQRTEYEDLLFPFFWRFYAVSVHKSDFHHNTSGDSKLLHRHVLPQPRFR
jgi:hypothetical protein